MSVLVSIVRAIGLPATMVIGLLFYYEGVPGTSRIPFLSSIPVLGDLTTGRVHTYAAEQVKIATASLVSRFELTAVQAQLDRERELRVRAERASTEAAKRADAAARLRSEALAALDARIAADTADDGAAVWTEEDIQWLRAR